jgi:hypothetical protein
LSNLEKEIQVRTEAFAQELAELVKKAALESVSQALAGRAAGGTVTRGRRGAVVRTSRGGGRKATATSARGRKKGEKRTPEELEGLANSLLAEIKREGNRGIEAIAKAMKVPTKELALPIRKLNEEGKIRTKGQKRATKYFAR